MRTPVHTGALCRYHPRTQQESDAVTVTRILNGFNDPLHPGTATAQVFFSDVPTVPQKSSPNAERRWNPLIWFHITNCLQNIS